MTDEFAQFQEAWLSKRAAEVSNEVYAELEKRGIQREIVGDDPDNANACVVSIAIAVAMDLLKDYDAFKSGLA